MSDAGLRAQIEQLIAKWRQAAIDSIAESSRIRSVTHERTGAEDRCLTRADLWRKCADELEALLASAPSPDPVAPRAPGGISEVEYAAAVANPPPRRAPAPGAAAETVAELLELVRAVLQAARSDEKGECWTIRAFLEQRGVYDGNLTGAERLIEEACKHTLAALSASRAPAQAPDYDELAERLDSVLTGWYAPGQNRDDLRTALLAALSSPTPRSGETP